MQVIFNFEKRHLVFLVVLACVLFVVGVSATYKNPATNVGHDANETGPGTFGGDANSLYSFPGNLNVNNGAAAFWWNAGEGEVLRLNGANGQNMHLEVINGRFRLLNSGWTKDIFSVGQAGDVAVADTGRVSTPTLCLNGACRNSWPNVQVRTGIVTMWSVLGPPTGFGMGDCALLVSMEDSHVGTANGYLPNYEGDFGDQPWSDNHYAGIQAYAIGHWDWPGWQIICRFGFTQYDLTGQSERPSWIDGKCRYLMVCSK